MKFHILSLAVLLPAAADAESFLVEDGQPRAEIIIAHDPPRLVNLAAKELQTYIERISGAKLSIVTEPSGNVSFSVFVGRSEHTDRLGVTDEGLQHGAFRMVSGPGHLVLLGRDYDFHPRGPVPLKRSEIDEARRKWDALTGSTWRNPVHLLYKDFNREFGIWRYDQGGSFNAVCELLRMLGVRWYMPGELGEVVPERKSIALPSINKVVRPDFALRCLKWSNYNAVNWDDLIWDRRLAVNSGYEVWGAKTYKSHGMRAVIGRKEMQKAHPEYYALRGAARDTKKNGTGTPCLRSEGLMRETVRYCRAVFDEFGEPMVCIWPTDGFKQCQCELCRDIDSVSDYVWGFVDQVGGEVYKTHPSRKVSCGAYASYVAPPPSIDKFSPNVVVYIANRGRPGFGDPERWKAYWDTIEGWRSKVAPGNIVRGENNTLFYGPARDEMQAAFEFADANFPATAGQKRSGGWVPAMEVRAEFVENLHTAREAAGETVYGRRVQLILDELPPLDELRLAKDLAVQRGDDVITYDRLMNLHNDGNKDHRETFSPDGKLDEPFWQWYPHGRNLQDADGGRPSLRTTFMARWYNNNIYFGIRCEEDGDEALNISTTRDDDPAILDGDRIELLIETTPETCYQLVINPAGALLDRETTAEGDGTAWSSNADIGVHVGDGFWSVEVGIPVAGEGEAGMDHLNRMVGRTPTQTWPWYFNVGRVRVRGDETHITAYSPIGDRDLTDRAQFGRLRLR